MDAVNEPSGPAREPVDEVSRDGTVLRTVTRGEMRAGRLRHRAVFIAVLDGGGRLLVHRRSADKDLWPGWWDVCVGGVLAAGEDWAAGAERELAEELGVTVSELVPLGDGLYEDRDVALVARCFVAVHDGPFPCPDGEITETRWVDAGGLGQLLSVEKFLPDGAALVLPRLDGFRDVMP